MRCEVLDVNTMIVVPESVSEQAVLMRFKEGLITLKPPAPFDANVYTLIIEPDSKISGKKPEGVKTNVRIKNKPSGKNSDEQGNDGEA